MRRTLGCQELLENAARKISLRPEAVAEIFADTPVDFTVIITSSLPFLVHRFGMRGITIGGRVYLLESVLDSPASSLIVLLRHEAEHVRQQRNDPWFYLRYFYGWARGFLPRLFSGRGKIGASWHAAYMEIKAEQEAYGAGDRARELLTKRK